MGNRASQTNNTLIGSAEVTQLSLHHKTGWIIGFIIFAILAACFLPKICKRLKSCHPGLPFYLPPIPPAFHRYAAEAQAQPHQAQPIYIPPQPQAPQPAVRDTQREALNSWA